MATRTKAKKTPAAPVEDAQAVSDLLVVAVLDMSGSMGGLETSVIEGFGDYIQGVKEDRDENGGEVFVSVTAFDTVDEHWYVAEPIDNIQSLAGRYIPRGGTALYDAIAHSITEAEGKLREMGRADMRVLHVTITDGGENASKEYSRQSGGQQKLASLIKAYEDKGTWTFVYLGAEHATLAAAQAVASGMGYSGENATFYSSTPSGTKTAMTNLSQATRSRRSSAEGATANYMAESGQISDDYLDPDDARRTPTPQSSGVVLPDAGSIVPPVQTGDVAEATGLTTKGSLTDLLGGGSEAK